MVDKVKENQFDKVGVNPFNAPIPGESLTTSPDMKKAWERPPQYTDADDCMEDIYLEIRAGAGGDEAAIFVGDLYRMYSRFSERNNWKVEKVKEVISGPGGFKEIIAMISGEKVYERMKFESGVHLSLIHI